jgi:DNA polymerase III sliding clamp (beta) subunit (PCNA family)
MKRQDLLTSLEIVKPGLSNRENIEQTNSFAFINGFVVTYNDEISISHPVEGLKIEGVVQAKELYDLLRKIKQNEIEIIQSGNEIQINAGRIKAGLTLCKEIRLPLKEIDRQGEWGSLPENFIKCLKIANYLCSKDSNKPILGGVHVNENGFVEGSDGFRIIRCQLAEKMPIKTFIISSKIANEVIKFDPCNILNGDGWVHFLNKNETTMSCRIFEDEYPDCSKFLKVKGIQIPFPKNINEILDRVSIFTKDNLISILLENNRIKIYGKSENGWFEEKSRVDYKGETLSFAISPNALKNIITENQTCIYSEKMLKFEGENWQCVVALEIKQ